MNAFQMSFVVSFFKLADKMCWETQAVPFPPLGCADELAHCNRAIENFVLKALASPSLG